MFGTDIKRVSKLTDEAIEVNFKDFAEGTKSVSAEEALREFKKNFRLDGTEPDTRRRMMILSAS